MKLPSLSVLLLSLCCFLVTPALSDDFIVNGTNTFTSNLIVEESSFQVYPSGPASSSFILNCATTTEVRTNGLLSIYGVTYKPCASTVNFNVRNNGQLTLDNVWITSNTNAGLLFYCEGTAKITISNSFIQSNTFISNVTNAASNCTFNLVNTVVNQNIFGSNRLLSALTGSSPTFLVDSSTIGFNTAATLMYSLATSLSLTIQNSTIQNNTMSSVALFHTVAATSIYKLTVTGSNFNYNRAATSTIFHTEKSVVNLSTSSSSFTGNVGTTYGIFGIVDSSGPFVFSSSTLTGNVGPSGGLLYMTNSLIDVDINTSSFLSQTVTGGGSVLYANAKIASLSAKDVTIVGTASSGTPLAAFAIVGTSTSVRATPSSINLKGVNLSNSILRTGGVFYATFANSASVTIDDSSMVGCNGGTTGLGLVTIVTVDFTSFVSRNCTVTNNSFLRGVAVSASSVSGTTFLVQGWNIQGNTSPTSSGSSYAPFYFSSLATPNITVTDCYADRNTARYGSFAYYETSPNTTLYIRNNFISRGEEINISGNIETFSVATSHLSITNNTFSSGKIALLANNVGTLTYEDNIVQNFLTNYTVLRLNTVGKNLYFRRNKIINNTMLTFVAALQHLIAIDESISYNSTVIFEDNLFENNIAAVNIIRFLKARFVTEKNNVFVNNSSPSSVIYYDNAPQITVQGNQYIKSYGTVIVLTGNAAGTFDSIKVMNSTNQYAYASGDLNSIIEMLTSKNPSTFNNSEFSYNTIASGNLFNLKFLSTSSFLLTNSVVNGNNGYLLYSIGLTNIVDSSFSNNFVQSSDIKAFIEVSGNFYLKISGSTFSRNNGYHILYGRVSGQIDLDTCTFENNELLSIANIQLGTFNIVNSYISEEEVAMTTSRPCLEVGQSGTLQLNTTTIHACKSTRVGAISSEGSLFIYGSDFSDSYGGLTADIQVKGSFIIEDCTFTNSASDVGTSLYFIGIDSKGSLKGSKFINPTSDSGPSAIQISDLAQVEISDLEIEGGSSIRDGSCVSINSAVVNIKSGNIHQCTTGMDGGAIKISGESQVTIEDVIFESNQASQQGGDLVIEDLLNSVINVNSCQFIGSQGDNGGSLSIRSDPASSISFSDCSFYNTKAKELGGVFFVQDESVVVFEDCTFENNTAILGGVGYLDWRSQVSISNSVMTSGQSSSSGGSFYLDKYSVLSLFSSKIQKSVSSESGGAIFMNLRSILIAENTEFQENSALLSGGAIATSLNGEPHVSLVNVTAKKNFAQGADGKGGFMMIDQQFSNTFNVSNFVCQENVAAYGGCFSLEDIDYTPNFIEPIQYIDNVATILGTNINTPPSQLQVNLTSIQMLSGATLPSFSAYLRNSYGDLYALELTQKFLVVVILNNPNQLTSKIAGETQIEIDRGIATFGEDKLTVTGNPGSYILYVGPRLTDKTFSPSKFGNYFELTILDCPTEGYSVLPNLVCKKIECSECKVNQGVCVSAGNCSCIGTWEGLRCDLSPNQYDSVDLFFSSLPSLPSKKRADSLITVEMREFLIAEITKSLNDSTYTVEYRQFYQTDTGYVLKVSILKGDQYIEGAELGKLETAISTYFTEKHNIEVTSTKNEAIIATIEFSNPFAIAVIVLSFFFIVITLGFVGMIFWFREHRVIKASSPLFSMLILIGVLLAYLSFFPYIGEQTPYKCAMQPLLTPVAFSIVFGNLFIKTFRIYRIFANKRLQFVAPSNKVLFVFSSIVTGIELIIIIVWLSVDPPKPTIQGSAGQRYWGCESENKNFGTIMTVILIVYNGGLLLFGSFLAFATRSAYSAYRESQIIGFCIYTLTVVGTCILSVLYIPDLNLETHFALKTFGVIFVTTCILLLLFCSKLFLITRKNVDDLFTKDSNSTGNGSMSMSQLQKRKNSVQGGEQIEEEELRSWLIVKDDSLFSRWERKYVVYAHGYFGIYDSEEMTSGFGSYPIANFSAYRNPEDKLTFRVRIYNRKFFFDSRNNELLEKWFFILSRNNPDNTSPSRFLEKSVTELTQKV